MKDIKVIVFDFDNTLYYGIDWTKEWANYCKIGMREVFSELTDKQFDDMIKKEDAGNFTSNNIVRIMKKYKKDINLWLNFRQTHDCHLDYSNCSAVSNEELHKFAKKYHLYIVSNSIKKEMQYVIDYFKMDTSVFKKIITNNYEHGADKLYYYQQIIKSEGILPHQLFVIGDSQSTDLEPAFKIGASGILVKNCNFKMEDFGL